MKSDATKKKYKKITGRERDGFNSYIFDLECGHWFSVRNDTTGRTLRWKKMRCLKCESVANNDES